MQSGFYILSINGGYYPYVLVGWVERHDFLLRVVNSRVIRRFGNKGQLSAMAKKGPVKHPDYPTQLLNISPEEWVPLASVSRAIPADPGSWKECPKPEEWNVS